jgi:hypothetical protein
MNQTKTREELDAELRMNIRRGMVTDITRTVYRKFRKPISFRQYLIETVSEDAIRSHQGSYRYGAR